MRQYFQSVLFVVLCIELFLVFVAIVFGKVLGLKTASMVCFWLGVVVIGAFALVLLANFVVALLYGLIVRMKG